MAEKYGRKSCSLNVDEIDYRFLISILCMFLSLINKSNSLFVIKSLTNAFENVCKIRNIIFNFVVCSVFFAKSSNCLLDWRSLQWKNCWSTGKCSLKRKMLERMQNKRKLQLVISKLVLITTFKQCPNYFQQTLSVSSRSYLNAIFANIYDAKTNKERFLSWFDVNFINVLCACFSYRILDP